jgi:hypothetical protein
MFKSRANMQEGKTAILACRGVDKAKPPVPGGTVGEPLLRTSGAMNLRHFERRLYPGPDRKHQAVL